MSDTHTLVVEHSFDCPRELVWRAWTEPELIAQWYGPGADTTIHTYELKPNGLWLNEMRWGERAMFTRITFTDVQAPGRLCWIDTASDSDWNPADAMTPDWPQQHLHELSLTTRGERTALRLVVLPKDASAAELATFDEKKNMMAGGWSMGFAQMETLLASLI